MPTFGIGFWNNSISEKDSGNVGGMKAKIFQSEDGRFWGVYLGAGSKYHPIMTKKAAEAIVEMENGENPPMNWKETKDRLSAIGITAEDLWAALMEEDAKKPRPNWFNGFFSDVRSDNLIFWLWSLVCLGAGMAIVKLVQTALLGKG